MDKTQVFLSRALPAEVVDRLRRVFVVADNPSDRALTADEFAAAAAECDGVLVTPSNRGAIAAAGLDVFENEPRLDAGYASLRNVVLTPHIGSATMATRVKMVQLAIGNLVAAVTGGDVPAPVNPQVLPIAGVRRIDEITPQILDQDNP